MIYEQGVEERLDWSFNWTRRLVTDETIAEVVWAVQGLDWDTPSVSGPITTCFFEGGEAGKTYSITCKITTSQGRKFQVAMRLRIVSVS